MLIIATVLNLDAWVVTPASDLEGEFLDGKLDLGVGESTANETLDIEDTGKAIAMLTDCNDSRVVKNSRVTWIRLYPGFCSIADETSGVRERNIRWGCPVTMIVGDDFNMITFPDTDTPAWDEMSTHENEI